MIEIDVPVKDLVPAPSVTPQRSARIALSPKSAPRPNVPRTIFQAASLNDAASIRNNATATSSRPSTIRTRPPTPPESSGINGLKRLRLSNSASISSVPASRSTSANRLAQRSSLGPQARSPTAEKASTTVPIGRLRSTSPSPSPKAIPRSMSGPLRQLVTRPSPKLDTTDEVSFISSRTSRTDKSNVIASKPAMTSSTPAAKLDKNLTSTNAEAGPSRPRTTSVATIASVRSKAPSTISKAPSISSVKSSGNAKTSSTAGRASRITAPTAKSDSTTRRPRTSSVSTTASTRSRAPSNHNRPPLPTKTITTPRPFQLSSSNSFATRRSPELPQTDDSTLPVSSKPLSSATAARLRSTSNASTASRTSFRNRPPPTSMPMPKLKPSVRSPSSSTDEPPEARTPQSSQIIDPVIRSEGSDRSDLARSTSPRKPVPPVSISRQTRKSSSSSVQSTASALRFHPASAFDPPERSVEAASPPRFTITDGSKPFTGAGLSFSVGIPCIVSLSSKRARFKAQVKYIGHMRGVSSSFQGYYSVLITSVSRSMGGHRSRRPGQIRGRHSSLRRERRYTLLPPLPSEISPRRRSQARPSETS